MAHTSAEGYMIIFYARSIRSQYFPFIELICKSVIYFIKNKERNNLFNFLLIKKNHFAPSQVDSDDVITRDEQIYLLIGAKASCERAIRSQMNSVQGGKLSFISNTGHISVCKAVHRANAFLHFRVLSGLRYELKCEVFLVRLLFCFFFQICCINMKCHSLLFGKASYTDKDSACNCSCSILQSCYINCKILGCWISIN